jgi:hypothetical protein
MGTTAHHGFPFPDGADPAKPRIYIQGLAEDVDDKTPKITYGTATEPTDPAPREGDLYFQYIP